MQCIHIKKTKQKNTHFQNEKYWLCDRIIRRWKGFNEFNFTEKKIKNSFMTLDPSYSVWLVFTGSGGRCQCPVTKTFQACDLFKAFKDLSVDYREEWAVTVPLLRPWHRHTGCRASPGSSAQTVYITACFLCSRILEWSWTMCVRVRHWSPLTQCGQCAYKSDFTTVRWQ